MTLAVDVSEDVARGMLRVDGFVAAEDVPEGVGVNALVGPALADMGAGSCVYSARVSLERA